MSSLSITPIDTQDLKMLIVLWRCAQSQSCLSCCLFVLLAVQTFSTVPAWQHGKHNASLHISKGETA